MILAWKSIFGNLIFFLCLLKVHSAPWTLENNNNKAIQDNDYVRIDNYGDSESGTIDAGGEINEDEYHTYMEKKIARIIQNGSIYLEGLRKALQRYSEQMEDCAKKYNTIKYTNPSEVAAFNRCETATADTERIRKVAQLALWTTRQIQNRELTYTYHEDDSSDKSLLLRLAWLLDRLAHMTGYEPKPEDFLNASPASTSNTFPPALASLNQRMNITDDLKMKMINCLDRNNNPSQPAYERCPSESPMIEPMRKLFNISETTTSQVEPLPASSVIEQSAINQNPEINNDKAEVNENIRKKRDINNEISNERQDLMQEIKKQFKTKLFFRELTNNKNVISNYLKEKKVNKNRIERNVNNVKIKRDIYKELSRTPEDSYQDISNYVKFKEGTNVRVDPVITARMRLSLEQTFQNPNIEISRRYGANYNPLVPNVLAAGLFRSILDV